jgi:hypothetical protein
MSSTVDEEIEMQTSLHRKSLMSLLTTRAVQQHWAAKATFEERSRNQSIAIVGTVFLRLQASHRAKYAAKL